MKFFIFILILLMLIAFFNYTKDYPQCRASRAPILCVELMKK